MELIRCDRCRKEMLKTEEKAVMILKTGDDIRRGSFGESELPIDLCMKCKEEVKNFAIGISREKTTILYSDGEEIERIIEQGEQENE